MSKQAKSSNIFSKEFDRSFYEDQIHLINEDIAFYQENAKEHYDKAEKDYKTTSTLTVIDSDNKERVLEHPNDERQFIKRRVGLVAGSKNSIKVKPVSAGDMEYREDVQAFLDHEYNAVFDRLKQQVTKSYNKIGNGYIGTFFNPRLYNHKYRTIGKITQEVLPYYEVVLDKDSRNNMDYEASTFRDRETRIERVPLIELKRRAKASPYIEDSVAEGIPHFDFFNESDNQEGTGQGSSRSDNGDKDKFGYIVTHVFRRIETMKIDDDSEQTVKAEPNDPEEDTFEDYVYYYFQTINNNIEYVLAPIGDLELNKFPIDVIQYEIPEDSPYAMGYMFDTKQERQLLAEAITAELDAVKQSIKDILILEGASELDADTITRNMHKSGAFRVDFGVKVHEIGGKQVTPIFDQLIQRLQQRKQEKGGEYDLQAGRQQYSTETGKLANILNSRSDMALTEQITDLELVLASAVKTFLELAQRFYNMKMIIPRITEDENGETDEFVELNYNEDSMIDRGTFDIKIEIDLNSDVKKAENSALAQTNADILAPVDRLEMQGVQNPRLKVKNFMRHQGLLEIYEMIEMSPEAEEAIMKFIEQYKAIEAMKESADAQIGDSSSADLGENSALS